MSYETPTSDPDGGTYVLEIQTNEEHGGMAFSATPSGNGAPYADEIFQAVIAAVQASEDLFLAGSYRTYTTRQVFTPEP